MIFLKKIESCEDITWWGIGPSFHTCEEAEIELVSTNHLKKSRIERKSNISKWHLITEGKDGNLRGNFDLDLCLSIHLDAWKVINSQKFMAKIQPYRKRYSTSHKFIIRDGIVNHLLINYIGNDRKEKHSKISERLDHLLDRCHASACKASFAAPSECSPEQGTQRGTAYILHWHCFSKMKRNSLNFNYFCHFKKASHNRNQYSILISSMVFP